MDRYYDYELDYTEEEWYAKVTDAYAESKEVDEY